MHTSTLLSSILVAGTALAAPTSPIFRRQQDCGYYPDQANQATSTFILRIEALSNGISNATTTNATLTNSTLPITNGTTNSNATTTPNEILGYLDALSTSHGLVAPPKNSPPNPSSPQPGTQTASSYSGPPQTPKPKNTSAASTWTRKPSQHLKRSRP